MIVLLPCRMDAEVDALCETCTTCQNANRTGDKSMQIYLDQMLQAPCGMRGFRCVDHPGFVCERMLVMGD